MRNIFCFDSANEKTEVAKDRLYLERRKQAWGIMKEISGYLEGTEKQKGKRENSSKLHPWFLGEGKLKMQLQASQTNGPGDRVTILAIR
jgi:hypothetical protein